MSKLDEMRKASGGSIAESMGGGRTAAAIPGEDRDGPAPMPARLRGVRRRADVSDIPVEKVGPDPGQPRKEFDPDALRRLAESMEARGQLRPIRVRWDAERGQYAVIVGERRYQAAMRARLPTLACVVVEGDISPDELPAIQLVENAVREDLKPIEQANARKSLMDAKGWSQVELGAELGISQGAVARALATLRLSPEIQEHINRGDLSASAGATIAGLDDPEERAALAAEAMGRKLSRDEVVEAKRERQEAGRPTKPGTTRTTRGGGGGQGRLATSRTSELGQGYEITVVRKEGFDAEAWAGLLRAAIERVGAKPGPAGRGGGPAPA